MIVAFRTIISAIIRIGKTKTSWFTLGLEFCCKLDVRALNVQCLTVPHAKYCYKVTEDSNKLKLSFIV